MQVATCRPRDCLLSRVESGNNSSYKSIRTIFTRLFCGITLRALLWHRHVSFNSARNSSNKPYIQKFKPEASHCSCRYSTVILASLSLCSTIHPSINHPKAQKQKAAVRPLGNILLFFPFPSARPRSSSAIPAPVKPPPVFSSITGH